MSDDLRDHGNFGTYQQLRAHYRVGRTIIREAVRVVELHGFARMRSGRNGGLISAERSRDFVARLVGGRFRIEGGNLQCVRGALCFVSAVAMRMAIEQPRAAHDLKNWLEARPLTPHQQGGVQCTALAFPVALAEASGNFVLDLFARSLAGSIGGRDGWETQWIMDKRLARQSRRIEVAMIAAMRDGDSAGAATLVKRYHRIVNEHGHPAAWQRAYVNTGNVIERTRAGQIARSILSDLVLSDGEGGVPLGKERYLGSTHDFCNKFGVCRASAVQAIRILEALDVVVIRPGRSRGVFLKMTNAQLSQMWLQEYISGRPDGAAASRQLASRMRLEARLWRGKRRPVGVVVQRLCDLLSNIGNARSRRPPGRISPGRISRSGPRRSDYPADPVKGSA